MATKRKKAITKMGTRKVYGKNGIASKENWIRVFIQKINLSYQQLFPIKNGVLSYYTTKDILLDTYSTISYTKESVKSSEVFFQGQKGVVKTDTDNGIIMDSVFTREEKEAEFPGGEKGWRSHLERNLNPEVPVNRKAPPRTYQVIIKFIFKRMEA